MPAKVRDTSPDGRREEKKKRPSRSDQDKAERKERKERSHNSGSHRTSSTREKTSSRTSLSSSDSKRRSSLPGSDEKGDDQARFGSRTSLPYPTFSKAHSKEAVGNNATLNIVTPPTTDVDAKEKPAAAQITPTNGPPSPPLTDQNISRSKSAASKTNAKTARVDTIIEEDAGRGEEGNRVKVLLRPKRSTSDSKTRRSSDGGTSPTKPPQRASTPLKKVTRRQEPAQRSTSQPTRAASPAHSDSVTETSSKLSGSQATSIAPQQPTTQRPGSRLPSATLNKVSPVPMSVVTPLPSATPGSRQQTPFDIIIDDSPASQYVSQYSGGPPPPPPPPPPNIPIVVPRVDYLLKNGGLNQTVSRNLLYAGKPMAVQQAASTPGQAPVVAVHLFEPFNTLLQEYEKVIESSGSIAVATGYRSVARRLLDRLEAVFARDISSEECDCPMCRKEAKIEDSRGVSWGEVLELVSGRRDLPDWPPFAFVQSTGGPDKSFDMQAPMQKVDIDVPDEYREHYIRQSRKTKQSVDKWLSRQGDDTDGPPNEVDDETLTFAILTHIPSEQRQLFKDLLGIVDKPLGPPRRAPSPGRQEGQPPKPVPTPAPFREQPYWISVGSQAIQRLYRLGFSPRDAEAAMFLLENPTLHNVLATIAAISVDEWDILISGRFDGFLRSGAEDVEPTPAEGRYTPAALRAPPSRGPTPGLSRADSRASNFTSRGPTPAPQHGAPIALDEETEIATLAEIERDIYSGMEALEDAFEVLHQKAENVRRALRERQSGLAAAAQRRRGNSLSEAAVRIGTPFSGVIDLGDGSPDGFAPSNFRYYEAEPDDDMGDWDGVSEIAPDDSASNISTSRRRRPRRREQRRTPAPIEDIEEEFEDEDAAESERSRSPPKRR